MNVKNSRRTYIRWSSIAAVIVLIIAAPFYGRAQANTDSGQLAVARMNSFFQVGEELTYNVSYASVDIGVVRIKLVDKQVKDGRTHYNAIAYINSYQGIPFVDLHTIYESSIDAGLYSTWFRGRTKSNRSWNFTTYNFKYGEKVLEIESGSWESKIVAHRDSFRVDTLHQDGLSLFYFARAHARSAEYLNVPTVVREKFGNTVIQSTGERVYDELNAVGYDVDLVYVKGEAGFVGLFGLTGEFEGWFSNDDARVPIIAKMKVLIGNVRLELIKWTRSGWAPPRFQREKGK